MGDRREGGGGGTSQGRSVVLKAVSILLKTRVHFLTQGHTRMHGGYKRRQPANGSSWELVLCCRSDMSVYLCSPVWCFQWYFITYMTVSFAPLINFLFRDSSGWSPFWNWIYPVALRPHISARDPNINLAVKVLHTPHLLISWTHSNISVAITRPVVM